MRLFNKKEWKKIRYTSTALVLIILTTVIMSEWGTLEDFTIYTEVDPGDDISIAEHTITFTNLNTRNSDSYVYDDKGVDYFGGDFSFRFEFNITASENYSYPAIWALTNELDDLYGISSGGAEDDDFIAIAIYDNGSTSYIRYYLCEDGSATHTDLTYAISLSTNYYITVERDDDGGANSTGQYTMYVCTGNYYGESGSSTVHTITIDCAAGEQNDFRYLHAIETYNTGNTYYASGTVSNLDIGEVLPGGVSAGQVIIIEE